MFVTSFMKKVVSHFSMSPINSSIPWLLFGSAVAGLVTTLILILLSISSGTDGMSLKAKKKKKTRLTAVAKYILKLKSPMVKITISN